MKEHLLIKGMTFIGNQIIEIKLIPDPIYTVEKQINKEIDYGDLKNIVENVDELFNQKKELERTIYLGVAEWKKNKYNFASKIILDINPGE